MAIDIATSTATHIPLENPYGIVALWSQGDMVIKSIAIILLVMSVITWSIVLFRTIRLLQLGRLNHAHKSFWLQKELTTAQAQLARSSLHPLDNIYLNLVQTADLAYRQHIHHQQQLNHGFALSEWIQSSLSNALDTSAERLNKGLTFLASIGSTSPFVGLFGTVWGIYHALVKIGTTGQVGIDKVAGPVGEALIMTAFGLAVAIPAVLAYNAIARANKRVIAQANRFAHDLHTYYASGQAITPKKTQA